MLFSFLLFAECTCTARADYNGYKLCSVEWLVDTSDAIAVVSFDHEKNFTNPKIVRVFKGGADQIQFPMTRTTSEYDYLHSDGGGKLRLLFIRGKSELLQTIRLARYRESNAHTIIASFYGVTQYGELLLTESDLYKCVATRMRATRSNPIPWRIDFRTSASKETSQVHLGDTPATFPLENDSEYYCLRVPSDSDRRDRFLKFLNDGDAVEKMFAIEELKKMKDPQAEAAVRNAIHCSEAMPVYRYGTGGNEIDEWNVQSVRNAAASAVKFIEEHP